MIHGVDPLRSLDGILVLKFRILTASQLDNKGLNFPSSALTDSDDKTVTVIMLPPPRVGALSDDARLTSAVCLSRTERPRKTIKLTTEV